MQLRTLLLLILGACGNVRASPPDDAAPIAADAAPVADAPSPDAAATACVLGQSTLNHCTL